MITLKRKILATIVATSITMHVLPVFAAPATQLVWTEMEVTEQKPVVKSTDTSEDSFLKRAREIIAGIDTAAVSLSVPTKNKKEQVSQVQQAPDNFTAAIEEIQKRRKEDDERLKELLSKQKEQEVLRKKQEEERQQQLALEIAKKNKEQEEQKKQFTEILEEMKKQQAEILESLKQQTQQQQAQSNHQAIVTISPYPLEPEPEEPAPQKTVEQYVEENTQKSSNAPSREAAVVFSYSDAVLYQIATKEGVLTDLQLQPGEEIEYIGAGDTARWVVDRAQSGTGENRRWHIYIKPITSGITTNFVINTNRHNYQLIAKTTNGTPNPIVRWVYPQEEKAAYFRQQQQSEKRERDTLNLGTANPAFLDFDYKIRSKGNTSGWTPTAVFSDRVSGKTYIMMPESVRTTQLPILSLKEGKNLLMVNYRVQNNSFVVDRLFREAELRVGNSIVQIKKKD